VRTVTPGRYFYKSLKWLVSIELLAEDRLGYWEQEAGYHNHADPWREELNRLGLMERIDLAVFCRDVGWRKPAKPIFEFVLSGLQVAPERCLFVGDHPTWDVAGARAAGMDAVLVERWTPAAHAEEQGIHSLHELWGVLGR
jgi:FMN phosphatase YigB (HAD superfamily)